eukprot:gene38566-50649_t
MKFQGTPNYVATQDLMLSVNAAITLQRPLLVKGEPGTGKTMLAEEVASALKMPLLQWHIKSTTKAQQGLYEYDAVSRLRDSQLNDGDSAERVKNIRNYIVQGVLWQAFTADRPVALLIDEIDKADIEFPNDLLREIDRMEFHVYETRQTIRARHRPLVFITSNNEKELPDAFLRRCFFHYIKFPEPETMQRIVDVHFPGLKQEMLAAALKNFYAVRGLPGLKKKPSTSELLDWLKLLVAEDIPLEALQSKDDKVAVPPLEPLNGFAMPFVQAVTLRSNGIALVPLSLDHEDGLRAAAADGELWKLRITSVPEPHETRGYIETALKMREEGHRFAFAVTDEASGKVLGSTSYHDILPAVKRVETRSN